MIPVRAEILCREKMRDANARLRVLVKPDAAAERPAELEHVSKPVLYSRYILDRKLVRRRRRAIRASG